MGCKRSFVLGFKGAEEISAQPDGLAGCGLKIPRRPLLARRRARRRPKLCRSPLGDCKGFSPSGKEKPSKLCARRLKMPARRHHRVHPGAGPHHSSPRFPTGAPTPMNRSPKLSPTGIIGWRWATASELRTAAESHLATARELSSNDFKDHYHMRNRVERELRS